MKWEYRYEWLYGNVRDCITQLNKLGQEGWEAVAFSAMWAGDCILKRPILPEYTVSGAVMSEQDLAEQIWEMLMKHARRNVHIFGEKHG